MKTPKLTPRITAPVQRDNISTVPKDGNVITPATWEHLTFAMSINT
ncbi:anacyclamide/piricyclamide family prenylated cyclic peptide [Microcystis aeruginosa CS-558/01A06]|uniref:Anacyclamide/piricyclamide family prenylated cyclic peptide n=1 Tax=Microcystis aeruginosa BLCC-F108 TaxID=2755317 RepID=A0A841ULS3_MICAE|nr:MULTISPECIES: anacyclamide/piricyclamide family prenylated cyclic peptide [Microcystis]MBC1189569.1 anacyclamide/piricyclamide family prenylated cyclic peptide [Microcystis aeruginosa BLCC-F108]MCA2590237.1 anacyclamide/piricyclamide family prenylated cyclic peptide [Microcystis sp. M31BS1]MDB9407799.1 anacyclamide/piricyclamide family prenylated cyclic peptide [Microcystis aeruginosa CS-558/01A06]